MAFVVVEEGEGFAVVVEAPQENIAVALNAGPTEVSVVGGGSIQSINSLTASAQTIAVEDETNVTLAIDSTGSTHTITPGWAGTLAVARGGTGSGTQAGARSNLGAAASGANSDITSLSGLTTPLSIAQGGTSQITANAALNALLPSQTGQGGKILKTDGANTAWQTDSAGSGTVTSVAVTGQDGVGVSGSPVTTSGTIDLTLGNITPDSVAAAGTVTGSNLSGTNTGDQTITLTGDVTGTGTGSFAATIANDAVTFAKIQNITSARVLGRTTAASGDVEELSAGAGITISGGQIASSITQYTDELAQDAVGAMVDASLTYVDATPLLQRAALTGDVTAAAGSNATTVANDAVTYAKMQDVSAASKLLGRGDSGSGDPQEITLGTNLSMSGTTLNAASGGTPGGADTQLQYNNGGAFGGVSLATWDNVNTTLLLGSYAGASDFVTITGSGASGTGLKVNTSAGSQNAVHSITGASGVAFRGGTTGGRVLYGQIDDAGTTNAVEQISLYHNTSGTPSGQFGSRIAIYGESTTTLDRLQVALDSEWISPTDASRQSSLTVVTVVGNTSYDTLRVYTNTATQECAVLQGSSVPLALGANGWFALDVPSGSTSGGNGRGTNAIDLQQSRDNAADVASGGQAVILGGHSNRASNDYTVASGRGAHADRFGSVAHSAGPFSTSVPGDAQLVKAVWRIQTTNGTANTEMFLNGSGASARFTLVNNSTVGFTIFVLARRTNGDVENAYYKFEGAIKRDANAASTAIVGAVTKTVLCEDTAAWDCQVTADTTNGSLKIDVTGEAAKNINWVATGYMTETRE